MPEDPAAAVYGMVERAYVRMQAGEALSRCMDEGSPRPMQQLVEGLVIAGSQSLNAVREILAEVSRRSSQLQTDQDQVFSDLEKRLQAYHIRLGEQFSPASLLRSSTAEWMDFLRYQGVGEDTLLRDCVTMLDEACDLMSSMVEQQIMLDDMELYLEDWLWGLIYQYAREELISGLISNTRSPYPM
jgi:hypothetical protein